MTELARISQGSIGGLKTRNPTSYMPYINSLIYGVSGVGKTLLAGTAAMVDAMSPVLYIDAEEGALTLSALGPYYDRLDIVQLTDWLKLQDIYDDLRKGKHPYKTVVIDSGTEIQQMAMNTVLGTSGKVLDVGITPEFKDWYKNTEQIRRMIRAFRDLPTHTIITALEMDFEDPRTHKRHKRPAFSNKLAAQVPAFFDAVLYMYTREIKGDAPNERLLLTDKTDTVVAKCRVQGVPLTMKNPTMPTIYDYLVPTTLNGVVSHD
jgi:hypothetical protein